MTLAFIILSLLVLFMGFRLSDALDRIKELEGNVDILNEWADFIDDTLEYMGSYTTTFTVEENNDIPN